MMLMISGNHFALFYNFSLSIKTARLYFPVLYALLKSHFQVIYNSSSMDRFKVHPRAEWAKFNLPDF